MTASFSSNPNAKRDENDGTNLNFFLFLLKPKPLEAQRAAVLFDGAFDIIGNAGGDGGLDFQGDLHVRAVDGRQVAHHFVHDYSSVARHHAWIEFHCAVEAVWLRG